MQDQVIEQVVDYCLLKKVEQQEIAAREFGFYWTKMEQIIEQIQSECAEVLEANQQNDRAHLQEEIGDLLQAAISLVVFCQFDPQETLLKSINKFQQRYETVIHLAQMDGLTTLHQQKVEILEKYWKIAKQIQNNEKKTNSATDEK